MTYSQKYAIIQLLEPVEDGIEFSMGSWPLHTTLADVFAVDWTHTRVQEKLATLLTTQSPIETIALDDTTFGTSDQPVTVTLLKNTPALQSLHTNIIDILESCGATFNTPQYTKSGFTPHATVQKHARLHKGDVVLIDSLSVIDLFPNNDRKQRKVLQTISFT